MVTILLGKFREVGAVETEKGWIYLNDSGELRKVASC